MYCGIVYTALALVGYVLEYESIVMQYGLPIIIFTLNYKLKYEGSIMNKQVRYVPRPNVALSSPQIHITKQTSELPNNSSPCSASKCVVICANDQEFSVVYHLWVKHQRSKVKKVWDIDRYIVTSELMAFKIYF